MINFRNKQTNKKTLTEGCKELDSIYQQALEVRRTNVAWQTVVVPVMIAGNSAGMNFTRYMQLPIIFKLQYCFKPFVLLLILRLTIVEAE